MQYQWRSQNVENAANACSQTFEGHFSKSCTRKIFESKGKWVGVHCRYYIPAPKLITETFSDWRTGYIIDSFYYYLCVALA